MVWDMSRYRCLLPLCLWTEMQKNKRPLYIDIFAWCWWLSLWFFNSKKWNGLFAIEKSKDAFSTLKYNLIGKKNHYKWPKNIPCEPFDINLFLRIYSEYLKSLKGSIDLVMWWPPCQWFSLAWKRLYNDIRNNLVKDYLEFVRCVQPKIILFENVAGFTLSFKDKNKTNYSHIVIEEMKNMGYVIQSKIVNFSEYGVPQKRKRFILVWFLQSCFWVLPDFFSMLEEEKYLFLKEKQIPSTVSVEDAIWDLLKNNNWFKESNFFMWWYWKIESSYQKLLRKDSQEYPDSHRFPNHTEQVEIRFSQIIKEQLSSLQIKNKFWLKKNTTRLLLKDHPAPTLTTLTDDCIHYSEPRVLTAREYARIQSFNDRFEFKGKYTTGWKLRKKETPRYTQIWNAIPPLFWEIVGRVLYKILENNGRETAI